MVESKKTHIIEVVVARKVPCLDPLCIQTMLPRPRVTIRKWTEMRKGPDGQRHNDRSDLNPPPRRHRRRQEIEY